MEVPAAAFDTLLDLLPTGAMLLAPVWGAGQVITDFAFERVNPAAQLLLELPARPAGTILAVLPHHEQSGLLARYQQAYASGERQQFDLAYQADGLDGTFRLVVQRTGDFLLVHFTDLATLAASAVRQEPPASQGREWAAQAAAQQALQLLNEELAARVQAGTAQVQEQQHLLRQVLSNVPAAIATLSGPDHRFSFANDRYQELVGHRVQVGHTVAELLPEVVEQGVIELLDRVYQTGEAFIGREVVIMLEQPPGPPHQYHYDLTYLPLRDGQGAVQGILVFAVDVTEQVRARRQATVLQAEVLAGAQRRGQERQDLFQIFEQTPAAIVLLREPDHRIDYYNPAFAATFPPEGRPASALRGHTLAEAYPRMREAGLVQLLDRVFETGEPQVVLEMPLAELQPGSPRYVTFAYQAYREQGRIVGVAAFIYDATEQVLARRQTEQQRQLLLALFEQAPFAVVLLRAADYLVELVNDASAAILGTSRAQVQGRLLFEALPGLRGQGLEELYERAVAGETVVFDELPMHFDRAHTGQPGQGYLRVSYQPWRDAQGATIGVLGVGVEVTEQVLARQQAEQLNTELSATNASLRHANADLDAFVYTASHDLRSPIANIEGLVAALRQELSEQHVGDPSLDHLLGLIDKSITRFQTTIGHLTNVMKLQSGSPQSPPEPVDLATLINDVCLDLAPAIAEAQARVEVEVAEVPVVYFSPKDLRSIVFNLLSNAIKYRAPGRPPVVRVQAARRPQWLELRVQDNGLGLDAEQQGKLFGLFKRLHTHVEGSGVGLYSIKKLVSNAGGAIVVESEAGAGSAFVVQLPLAAAGPM